VASYRRDIFVSRCTPSKIEHLQSPKILHVPPHTIQNIKSPAFQLKVQINLNGRQFDAHALLDSGAEGVYCNTSFIKKYSIPTHAIDRPVYPINVDGTLNKQGAMRYAAILRMGMSVDPNHWETVEVAITNIGQNEILLGMDWLRAHNPSIDWGTKTIKFDCCPPHCHPSDIEEQDCRTRNPALQQLLPQDEWETQDDDILDITSHGLDVLQHIRAHLEQFLPDLDVTVSCHRIVKEQVGHNPTTQDVSRSKDLVGHSLTIESRVGHSPTIRSGSSPSLWMVNHQVTPLVARTTVSTSLAKKEQVKSKEIPLEFRKYAKVFSDEEAQRLPKHQPWDHKINLIPGQTMKKTLVYRLTPPEKVALQEYITDGLKRGTLRRSEAADACSFFFIDKKDRKLCPVQDYRPLNAITKMNAAPIPLIPELVNKLLEARFFTKLDVWWGYNNIHIRKGDEYKMAFKTPLGLFESLVMTFGLCNALATFQTFMDTELADLIDTGHVVIYLDNILIFAHTIYEVIKYTHMVLQRLLDLDLYLRPTKCSFNQTSIKYLGLIISEGELRMDPVKLKAVSNWPTLTKVKNIQEFLGFCNFYRRFVKNYSALARPLFDLTKKDTLFLWGTAQATAFAALQNALMTSPVLLLPDYGKPFTLITDASNYAMGAILEQDDALGRSHPVAYYSKSLQPAEQNYEIHDKELLAIVQALKHFCHYLQGNVHQTHIFSDHTNLKYFTTKQTLTCRQVRWSILLGTYDYIIIPKPGKLNQADGLSRRPDYKEGIASENAERVLLDPGKFLLKPEQFHI